MLLSRSTVASLLVLSSLAAAPVRSASATSPDQPVVVRFDPASSASQRAADLAAGGLRLVEETPGSDFALAMPTGTPGGAAGGGTGSIEAVAPLVTVRAFGIPDDPAYAYQWHLPAIDAASAWDITAGAGIVVAVIDSGVAYEDFGAFQRAPDLAAASFVPGWDFIDGDAHPNDENGHGTHVASAIVAATDNGVGVAGLAHEARIMPLRALDAAGAGSDWAAAQALRFAADNGADVANLSLGSTTPSEVMADAVTYARSRGVIVVAASGNQGGAVAYPAASPGVVAVGAVRLDLDRAAYSNFGPTLDLVAPGGDASVDQDGDGYPDGILQETFFDRDPTDFCFCFLEGTSMAAPQVSAVAALVASLGVSDPDAVEDVLIATAIDLGDVGRDDHFGYGLVQAGAAVRAVTASAEPPPGGVRGIEHACPSESTPPPSFTDIGGNLHEQAIGCVAWWEIASGQSAQRFEPAGQMTRAQLASFVARMIEQAGHPLPSSPPDAFADDDTSAHELRIDQLAALGVVQGRSDGRYAPAATVSRAEMATFLVRAHHVVTDATLAPGSDRFRDDDASVHEPNIDRVAAAGLAQGVSADRFAPGSPVLRGQMATFLARTLDLFVATGATPVR